MFFICLIQIPIGAAAWWICTKMIPWVIARSTLTNAAWVGVAGWGIASLFGWGGEYTAFVTDKTYEVLKVIAGFIFDEAKEAILIARFVILRQRWRANQHDRNTTNPSRTRLARPRNPSSSGGTRLTIRAFQKRTPGSGKQTAALGGSLFTV